LHKTEQDRLKRLKLFNKIDNNGNGLLSYSEIEMCLVNLLPKIFDVRPVLMRAYQTTINLQGSKKSKKPNDGLISKNEFRIFLKYIRQYYEYYVAFDRIDLDKDGKVTFKEFVQAKP